MSGESSATHGRALNLLLVDDSFGDAMLMQEAVGAAAADIRLSIAVDGEEALARLRSPTPHGEPARVDLVLLDLNLPRMDGRAVLKAIRADPDLRAVPVIIMTGSNAAVDIRDSYMLGANGYIVKPVHYEGLREAVSAIEHFWFGVAALPPRTMGASDAA